MNENNLSMMDFSDNNYTLKQRAIRNAYTLENSSGDVVLKSKQKMFKMKEEFPFVDSNENEVFSIKAQNLMDIAGDYAVVDPDGEELAVLTKDFTLMTHVWRIKDSEGRELAVIRSRGKFFGLLRSFIDLMDFFPHRYSIEDSEGDGIGEIKGKFSIRDRYKISLNEDLDQKELILAAAVAVDALEGN